MDSSTVYAFIGAGKMATAIALGLVKSGIAPDSIRAYDVSSEASKSFGASTGAEVALSMEEALSPADIVILAVKPQFAEAALAEAKLSLKGKLLISIAAGLPLDWLRRHAGIDRIVRVMPNTPALVGAGMSCYAGAPGSTEEDMERAAAVLRSVGRAVPVPESCLDAVTGLSGSGPAFVMEFIMGLADGGVCCGLPRTLALESAVQTVLGTAKMCQESGRPIAELRDAVISPAGTTACGILAMQKAGFKGIAASAVIEAARRSAELGKKE